MTEKGTLTILLTKGPYVSEAADMAMKTVLAAKRAGYEVNLFLYLDGTWVSHITKELDFSNPSGWLRSVIKRRVEVASCDRCSNARDLNEGEIIDGVRIAGSFRFIDMVRASDRVITFGG
jgi:tRNA 2-thiouridine synthesizing protein D